MKKKKKLEDEEILELENSLKKYLPHHKMYQRVLAVKMVKQGCTRIEVGNYMDVDRQTVGRWVKKYDENGIEGLEPDYSNCGRNCKLSDEQLSEFKEIITNPNEHYTIKKAMKLIEKRYGIKYSYKQVWEIATIKLGLNYHKPFLIYQQSPDDAENQLKKN